jgi:hypothetical protein
MLPNDPCQHDIPAALDSIKRIATTINGTLHERDNMLKMMSIASQFERDTRYIELVIPGRHLLKDGILKKKYSQFSHQLSNSKEYYFVLFNDCLVYASFSKNTMKKGNTYKMKHLISLLDLQVEIDSDCGDRGILISCDEKNFQVKCNDEIERNCWFKMLSTAIDAMQSKLLRPVSKIK